LQSNPSGLYNFGRCLEYGKGIERDFVRAAKYSRLAAVLNHPMAENSFGVCLKRPLGVHSNAALTARYYKRPAAHGDPNGANNLGFCLEHGRSVKADIESAAECYKFAWDCGHLDGELNYRRCLRILGRWEVPDRSSRIADHRSADDRLAQLFINCADDSNTNPKLAASIRRFKATLSPGPGLNVECIGMVSPGPSTAVKLVAALDGTLTAVKTCTDERAAESIRREAAILGARKHPLVVRYRGHFPDTSGRPAEISTEFVGNGSLANRLPRSGDCDLRPTRIARIISGIALAMRFLHSQGIVHCNLRPETILLDWDCNVRIAHFGQSSSGEADSAPALSDEGHYRASECYENIFPPERDVFSFGLILFELAAAQRAFPDRWAHWKIVQAVVFGDWRPEIPNSVLPETRKLISDCRAPDSGDRPLFNEILDRLETIQFKVVAGVKSRKIEAFVEQIEAQEAALAEQEWALGKASGFVNSWEHLRQGRRGESE
jgi:TPR repeat protein